MVKAKSATEVVTKVRKRVTHKIIKDLIDQKGFTSSSVKAMAKGMKIRNVLRKMDVRGINEVLIASDSKELITLMSTFIKAADAILQKY